MYFINYEMRAVVGCRLVRYLHRQYILVIIMEMQLLVPRGKGMTKTRTLSSVNIAQFTSRTRHSLFARC